MSIAIYNLYKNRWKKGTRKCLTRKPAIFILVVVDFLYIRQPRVVTS